MALAELPSPDYSGAPTALDVEHKIKGANWWPTDEGQQVLARYAAKLAVAGSIARFLRIVRWEPFVSLGVGDEVRYFRHISEEGRVQLGDGLLSLSSVSVLGRAYTISGSSANVFAEPANARRKNKPYTSLLLYPSGGHFGGLNWSAWGGVRDAWGTTELRPNAIAVTGEWGYCSTWPEDAFEAIVSRAGALTLSSVNQEQELSGMSQDGYSEQYDLVGPIDQKTALNSWPAHFETVARSYAKPKPGPTTLNTGAHAARNARNYLPTA